MLSCSRQGLPLFRESLLHRRSHPRKGDSPPSPPWRLRPGWQTLTVAPAPLTCRSSFCCLRLLPSSSKTLQRERGALRACPPGARMESRVHPQHNCVLETRPVMTPGHTGEGGSVETGSRQKGVSHIFVTLKLSPAGSPADSRSSQSARAPGSTGGDFPFGPMSRDMPGTQENLFQGRASEPGTSLFQLPLGSHQLFPSVFPSFLEEAGSSGADSFPFCSNFWLSGLQNRGANAAHSPSPLQEG